MGTTASVTASTADLSTRARIRDAAMAEFADKGYRGATLRGIAQRAGVSLGLVQHHFGTKDGLRAACDDRVLALVRIKTEAVEAGTIGDRETLATLLAIAPAVQRYMGRALVDGSPKMGALLDQVMDQTEAYLTSTFPDRFAPGTEQTRDAAAVMTALNTSTMFLQPVLARRLAVEPYSPTALRRIGTATFDVYESIAEMVGSPMWTALREGVAAHPDDGVAAAGTTAGDGEQPGRGPDGRRDERRRT